MNSVNKTLYIPLYGKSYVSKKDCFLAIKKPKKYGRQQGLRSKENPNPNGLPIIWEFALPCLMNGLINE